jgi:hypothetical protein
MGLFDFGDRAMIKTLAGRLMIGVKQLDEELNRSGGKTTPSIRGLVYALRNDTNEMRRLSNSLSESSRTSILINMMGQNVQLDYFYLSLAMISKNLNETNGVSFWDFQ